MKNRITVDDYHRMIETGILTTEDRVELLEGEIVEKERKTPQHCYLIMCFSKWLRHAVSPGWLLLRPAIITLADSEPEPEYLFARGPHRRYAKRHPHAEDVGLAIEMGTESLDVKRNIKARIYAAAGIPTYWIFDVSARVVEVYSQPKAGRNPQYKNARTYDRTEKLPLILDGKKVADLPLRELLK